MKKRIAFAFVLAILLCFTAAAENTCEVTLPYEPVPGCEWSYSGPLADIAEEEGIRIEKDELFENLETVTFLFRGIGEGTADLRFRYAQEGSADEKDAWLIRLNVDAAGNISKENAGGYRMRFPSYDGGGPVYELTFSEESVIHHTVTCEYRSGSSGMEDGAGYDEVHEFTGRRPGLTHVAIRCDLRGEKTFLGELDLSVDEELCVTRVNDRLYRKIQMLDFSIGGTGYSLITSEEETASVLITDSEEYWIEVPASVLNDAARILDEYNLDAWNGFDETGTGGESFSLYIQFTDLTALSARGSGAYPVGYGEARQALCDLIRPYADLFPDAREEAR